MLLARGAALVGRRVVREFSGVPFAGAVVAHEGGRWAYRVRYSDGDEDTNTLREVRGRCVALPGRPRADTTGRAASR